MGSKTLVLETGKIARQATASVIASMGGTVVMCAVVTKQSEVGGDFFPLSVHYMEKTYSAGKIPGGYFKREARPSEKEIINNPRARSAKMRIAERTNDLPTVFEEL